MFDWNILHQLYYLHRPLENVVSIFVNNVTQWQSMYEACSVSRVSTAVIFFQQPFYFVIGGTDCNWGNIQHVVQQSVNYAILGIILCSVVMKVENLSCWKLWGLTAYIGRTFLLLLPLPVNAGVWWWCTETTSSRETAQRVQVGIHHEDYTFQPGRSRTFEHSASGGTGFGKPLRHKDLSIAL